MAKSSLAIGLSGGLAGALLALPPAAAFAADPTATITAEQAIEAQHRRLQQATGTAPCPVLGESGEDIIVCGRRGVDPNRVPFPDQRMPGERVGLIRGEPPSALAALHATRPSSCSTVGPNQRCGGGLPVFQTLMTLAKIGKHLIDPDE